MFWDSPPKWSGGEFWKSRTEIETRHGGGYVHHGGELRLSNSGQLELLRGMAERGAALRTEVRGSSMHPFIRDGDILTIAPIRDHKLRLGEVVAFTQPESGRLAVHRIIGRIQAGWLIRGDNSPESDGAAPKENIIGRVTRIERGGRDIRLGLGRERVLIALLNRGIGLAFLKRIRNLPRRAARFILRSVQSLPLYRRLGRRFPPLIVVFTAGDRDMETIHRMLNPVLPYRREESNPNATTWVAKNKEKIVGFVQLVNHPADNAPWTGTWLFSLHVDTRFRGRGIGESLTRRVIEEAEAQGNSELFLTVSEDNVSAIRLYGKFGFVTIRVPALETIFQNEKSHTGRRRIVMRKTLKDAP